MPDVLDLEDIDLTGIEDHPETDSIKLWGPPGTGKTTQSAGRVGRLLRDHGYYLADVAWATYRRSLALDTLKRFVEWDFLEESELDELHAGPTRYIATIHAVANRTVGDLPDPVEPWHKREFCGHMDMQFHSQNPWEDTPGQLLFDTFGWMKNNRLDPRDPADVHKCPVADDLRASWQGDVGTAYSKWQDYKAQRDVIDFYEMLERCLEQRLVPTSDVIVIDEYHDATALMAALCEFWVSQADVAIVAGDPNQVVNSFRGADPRFFERLDLPRVLLEQSYRVPEHHWRAAVNMLRKAHDVPQVDVRDGGFLREYRPPEFEHHDESGWLRPKPHEPAGPVAIVDEYGEDALFLARTQMQADGVAAALEKGGVIYGSQADLRGWTTDAAADRLALYNALQKIREYGPGDFDGGYGLGQYSDGKNPDRTTLGHTEAIALLEYANASTLAQSRSDTEDVCERLEDAEDSLSLSEFADYVEPEFWGQYTAGPASVGRLNKNGMTDRDRMAIQQAVARYDDPVDPADITVHVLTIHASKGWEAENVVVYDGVPKRVRRDMRANDRAYRNEMRTWYVALTRASKRLHIMRGGFQWTNGILPDNIRDIAKGAPTA